MGRSDTYSKDLLQQNEFFADTINNALFGGEQVVNPSELKEMDPTELQIVEGYINDRIPVQKYRDVLKQAVIRTDNKTVFAIIGIENQTSVHYAMPVKNLLYDAIRYAKQVENRSQEYKKSKPAEKLTREEFLSGWKKSDHLIPVITLTVYFGTKEWDGPRSIHEMLDPSIDERVLKLIPDYRIHLLEPNKIVTFETFKSDIGLLYNAIAVSKKEEGVNKLILSDPERFSKVDNRIVRAINFYTRTSFVIETREEKTDMSYAAITADANAVIEAAVNFGNSLEKTIEYVTKKYKGITDTYVTEKYNMFLKEKEQNK